MGLSARDVGNIKHYCDAQFALIAETGGSTGLCGNGTGPWPDGRNRSQATTWPPHGSHPPEEALESLSEHSLRIGIFYDSEIRFGGLPRFIVPAPPVAEQFVRGIVSFYRRVPPASWLLDPSGDVPIVIYGYQFSDGGSLQHWDAFFEHLVEGVASELDRRPVFYWTDAGSAAQAHAYQRFPEVRPFNFNPCHPQSALGSNSVTFVVSYDDCGVRKGNLLAPGTREHDLIINDLRLAEEALSLALTTDPSLLVFYGWNELFEGEALLPDMVHGRWRLDVASAVLRTAKAGSPEVLPIVALVADDLFDRLSRSRPGLLRDRIPARATHGDPPHDARRARICAARERLGGTIHHCSPPEAGAHQRSACRLVATREAVRARRHHPHS